MIDLHAELPKRGFATRMILTVHDELLFEASARRKPKPPPQLVRERMEGAVDAERAADRGRGIRRKLARREAVAASMRCTRPRQLVREAQLRLLSTAS